MGDHRRPRHPRNDLLRTRIPESIRVVRRVWAKGDNRLLDLDWTVTAACVRGVFFRTPGWSRLAVRPAHSAGGVGRARRHGGRYRQGAWAEWVLPQLGVGAGQGTRHRSELAYAAMALACI